MEFQCQSISTVAVILFLKHLPQESSVRRLNHIGSQTSFAAAIEEKEQDSMAATATTTRHEQFRQCQYLRCQ
jgi:hypothetical protein